MIKIHTVSELTLPPGLRSCRVHRVDACNAVCMAHKQECLWATPYGNYCEHPLVSRIAEFDPHVDGAGFRFFLH